MTNASLDPGSFRDRESRVFTQNGRLLRGLSPVGLAEWERLSGTAFWKKLAADRRVPATERVEIDLDVLRSVSPRLVAALEHERLPFVSYPYEWSYSMLRDAAVLTLDVVAAALNEGMILKDASAYNVQFRGAQPVFIDVGSFETWRAGEPWVGYRQFCQLFLYPLMLRAYKGVPFQPWLRGAIDGIEPAEMAALLSMRDALRPGVATHVLLQAKLGSGSDGSTRSVRRDLAASGFSKTMIANNVAGLERTLARLRAPSDRSTWSQYVDTHSYAAADYEAKCGFVERALVTSAARSVLDLGCNTGEFSRLASATADFVVAVDGDEVCVDRLYRKLAGEGNTKILPLVMRLTDPSPSLGWRSRERRSLEQRAAPDLVLALALSHHLVLAGNIPVPSLLTWLAELGRFTVVEFVSKQDAMVVKLLRDKIDNFDDWERPAFESELEARFEVLERLELGSGTRFLYFARSRAGRGASDV